MSRYLDEFVRCRCAPDLLARKLFPNAKEVTESFAAYAAVRKHADVCAENQRRAEEIASAPPDWSYPIAWRLAVMAFADWANNNAFPPPFKWAPEMTLLLKRYHRLRLEGLLPSRALAAAAVGPIEDDDFEHIICAAYERGRPGPGGVRLGRPANG